ncbi:LysR family transcriptional regulator [Bacillus sp. AFS017336]|uniref:LysR family transcriptional regulator n=1 Tax=Bacillus sp. AFS017336 TaxID=2033489 RepID=UPI000BEF3EAA|nr:LysR family transcriptional regulator [Bacillus sp. AFS017336]PEL04372.1 hypothetical protein CN601_21730 [Bacillus sp. AFS017336]
MYLEKLNYILEVAKERSIVNASQNLHISASVISQSITQLEKEWGLRIFNRTKAGTILTEEGKAVIRKISEILAKYQELKHEINMQTNKTKAKLKVSCVPSLTNTTFNALRDFKRDYPEIDVYIQEMNRIEVLKDIKSGYSDIGLLPQYEQDLRDEIDINYEKLFDGKLCVCVNSESFLRRYEFLTPKELINEKLAMYNEEYAKLFAKQHFADTNILFTTTNTQIIKRAIMEEDAITITYDKSVKNNPEILSGQMFSIPLKVQGFESQPFWYIYTRNKPFTNITQEFISYVKNNLS